ncbi:MAG: sodium:solute symporter family protein [Planctomycetota bacterium]
MQLEWIDWAIIGAFLVVVILIGLIVSKKAGSSSAEFFLGGRSMPWWLLGISMVACTFSCDTPNLVTGMVREGGVVANWGWWAFLITGMVTVFIYAQLWRRSKVMTDLEFYELRYSGKSAAFIRGFRSLYLGVFFNCLIMGTVTLAAIKIGQVIFNVEPWVAVVVGSAGVVFYAAAGGIKSCIWADFFQYSIAMFGAVYAAIVACRQPEIGGLTQLLANPAIVDKLSWMPDFSTWLAWVPMLLIPVAVQWWAVWYPGAEPGGGGYIAQRMLAAKDEKNAIGATMLFNFMHYAIRPWPWIIVALASIVCYPTLASIKTQFPGIDPAYLRQDIAYPVMIAKLGPGFLGLVVASLIAAYMSTIGTHLNWGSSYAVNDFYKRFWKKDATEKQMVRAGRFCTVGLMMIAGIFALTFLEDAYQAFKILLLSGAGTGAIYIMRWFWWRINAWTEIMAMVTATVVAFWIVLGVGSEGTLKWYIGSGAVQDRVFTVADAEIVKEVNTQRGIAADQTKALKAELSALAAAWKKANKENAEARDAARVVYDTKVSEIDVHKAANSVTTLVDTATDRPWSSDLQKFYTAQNQWELDRVNKRRVKSGLEPKPLGEVAVGFLGLVSGDTIYIYHPAIAGLEFSVQLLVCIVVVTIVWVVTTLITPAVDTQTLRNFYRLCHPGGPGWRKVVTEAKADGEDIDQKNAIGDWKLPIQILCVFLGCVTIYASLFAIGNFVYGNMAWGFILIGVALVTVFFLFKSFGKIGAESGK